MIKNVNFILTVNVGGEKYVYAYESKDLDEVLEQFFHEDYEKMLAHLKEGGEFLIDVLALRDALGGKVFGTYKVGFNATVFHHFYDKGWKCNEKGEHITYTLDEFHQDLINVRLELESREKFKNDATSLLFYMWNRWCLEECKIVWKDGDWNHFWNKWCGYNSEYGRFGAVEDFYASLTNDNRDKLVRRACEMYDGSREKY